MGTKHRNFLFDWRNRIASDNGPRQALARHVALTLSLHMDLSGGSCYPSIKTISKRTGLSERVVGKYLHILSDEGWLQICQRKKTGRGWRQYQYQAVIPEVPSTRDDAASSPHAQRGDAESSPCAQGHDSYARRGDAQDINVVTEGNTISSYNTKKNTQDPGNPIADQESVNECYSPEELAKIHESLNAFWEKRGRLDKMK